MMKYSRNSQIYLGSVIVQQRLGNSLEDIDVLLEILMVLHLSLKEAGIIISENFRTRTRAPAADT